MSAQDNDANTEAKRTPQKTVLIIIAVLAAAAAGFAFTLYRTNHPDVAAVRKTMGESMTAQCVKTARGSAAGRLSDDQIQGFCSCTATRLNAALSDAEINSIADQERHGVTVMPPEVASKIQPITAACRADAKIPG
ncbi:MAG: hypothetical protein PW843_29340 [Azospirillaceae bacterium]|nr:hypothetical protein [Azospirillaceae bacterium]